MNHSHDDLERVLRETFDEVEGSAAKPPAEEMWRAIERGLGHEGAMEKPRRHPTRVPTRAPWWNRLVPSPAAGLAVAAGLLVVALGVFAWWQGRTGGSPGVPSPVSTSLGPEIEALESAIFEWEQEAGFDPCATEESIAVACRDLEQAIQETKLRLHEDEADEKARSHLVRYLQTKLELIRTTVEWTEEESA